MTGPDDTDRDDAALAAEFALHLLDANERAAFERRLAVEPDLQRLVREWDEHFAVFAQEVAGVKPPRRLKKAVTARLHGAEPAAAPPPLWLRWRLGIGGAVLALLVGLALLFGSFTAPPESPRFTAELAAEDRSLVVRASLDVEAAVLRVEPLAGGAPAGRVLEMWLIAEDASAPVSLGIFADDAPTVLAMPGALRDRIDGATLAISDEPPGGSPTGAPTGSVLAVGQVTRL